MRDAVLADPELSERQKQMLLEVYESFRKESAADGRNQTVLVGEVEPADHEHQAEPATDHRPSQDPNAPSVTGMGQNRVA